MRLVILGYGGYGRTIQDIAEQIGKYQSIVMLDDKVESAQGKLDDFTKYIDDDTEFYCALGDNKLRYSWLLKIDEAKGKIATIIHPTAYVSPKAVIGKGSAILPHASVGTNAVLCYGVIVNMGATVDHDCVLGNAVHVAPGEVVRRAKIVEAFIKVDSQKNNIRS